MSGLIDPGIIDIRTVIWVLLLAWGLYLFITSQPLGKPRVDPIERLDRLDIEQRLRIEGSRYERKQTFRFSWLEAIIRPVMDDVGNGLRGLFSRFGLGGEDLERKLDTVRPGVSVSEYFGEKALIAVLGGAIFPVMHVLGLLQIGDTLLVWISVGGAVAGFFLPDLQLSAQIKRKRTEILMELPAVIDMLMISTSAGLGVEQALEAVSRQSRGQVATELTRVTREIALGQRTLNEALEALAQRSLVQDLATFASQLRSAHEQGLPLNQALAAQGDALRERKRVRIIEHGKKAEVKMILPVAVFILIPMLVMIGLPAAIQIIGP